MEYSAGCMWVGSRIPSRAKVSPLSERNHPPFKQQAIHLQLNYQMWDGSQFRKKNQLIEQRTNTILSVNELKLRKIYSVCLIIIEVEGLDAMKVYRRRKTNIISQQRQGHENAPKLRLDRLNNSLALHMFSVNRQFFRSNFSFRGIFDFGIECPGDKRFQSPIA